ncbi:MAG TPA: hypothetical protein PKA13_19415 [Geminicoccaceae bacterium]|nr:hypothetical protein [Geminicoccus sp.]HMU51954.1 hypothetical protein [Geminicoccaceae bacterium]
MIASTTLPVILQDRRSRPASTRLRDLLARRRTLAELRRLLETSSHLLADIGLDADEVAARLGRSARWR